MKARTNTNKKSSARKKLIPAAGSLMISAAMLSTSTYAWFTMSKEVELKGINMTATVPENIQISLGDGQATGTLAATFDSTSNRLKTVTAPGNDAADPDWSNSLVVSDYYRFGRLTPATSKDGENIWYTDAATGVGKTLAGQQIGTDGTAETNAITATFTNAITDKETASAGLAVEGKTGSWNAASSDKYEDGGAYYIDIPVWFRSSINSSTDLAVKATISKTADTESGYSPNSVGNRADGFAGDTTTDLYKAVRVSILDGTSDGDYSVASAAATQKISTTGYKQGVIYDSTGTRAAGSPVSEYYAETAGKRPATGAKTVNAATAPAAAADWVDVVKVKEYNETMKSDGYVGSTADVDKIINIPASGGKNAWGSAVRYTVRIWIDGEDVNCWNATAGQDFTITLDFCRIAAASGD